MANRITQLRTMAAMLPAAEVAGLARGVATLPTVVLPGGPQKGDGGVVRVLPGYMTGDWSTVALRAYLRSLGYQVSGWDLKTNRGDVPSYTAIMRQKVATDADRTGRPVRLVGWSLGGVVAREVARQAPADVQQVVTLGSPVVGYGQYRPAGGLGPAPTTQVRTDQPIHPRITALYSKSDEVVPWRAALDPDARNQTEHIEVAAKHAELGVSAPILRMVGEILATG